MSGFFPSRRTTTRLDPSIELESASFIARFPGHNRFRVSAYKLVAASAKEAGGGEEGEKGTSINRDDPRGGQLRPRRKEGCRTISPWTVESIVLFPAAVACYTYYAHWRDTRRCSKWSIGVLVFAAGGSTTDNRYHWTIPIECYVFFAGWEKRAVKDIYAY